MYLYRREREGEATRESRRNTVSRGVRRDPQRTQHGVRTRRATADDAMAFFLIKQKPRVPSVFHNAPLVAFNAVQDDAQYFCVQEDCPLRLERGVERLGHDHKEVVRGVRVDALAALRVVHDTIVRVAIGLLLVELLVEALAQIRRHVPQAIVRRVRVELHHALKIHV